MPFRVTRHAIVLPTLPSDVRSVDIFFGEERVWSIDIAAAARAWHRRLTRGLPVAPGRNRHPWPEALRDYLVGQTTVTLRDSRSGRTLGEALFKFSDSGEATTVTDRAGHPLSVNKWGRLSKTLTPGGDGVQERILAHTDELVRLLDNMNLRPFIVGGTLLGAIRDGALLPHDDDADIAYLSRFTDPTDVAREGFEVGRRLTDLGYEIVRHSATHMQLLFRDATGAVDHYVDIFGAFFTEDGHTNQPFHVRGEMRRDQLLPFGNADIAQYSFPTPADVNRWLTINYDENWQTPIPGYQLLTPRDTIRRFDNWFGIFSSGREFWNDHFREAQLKREVDPKNAWSTSAKWISAHSAELQSRWCIDLGCGDGRVAAILADHGGRHVVAADYSRYALEAAQTQTSDHLSVHHVNLLQLDSLALPTDAGVQGPFDLIANHLLDSLDPSGRPQALRLIRMSLKSGGTALATLYAKRNPDRSDDDPDNWFWGPNDLIRSSADLGMRVSITRLRAKTYERHRRPYAVRFYLTSRSEDRHTL